MRVAIVGPGSMGVGIATRLLAGGHDVTLVGRTEAQAKEAAAGIDVANGSLTPSGSHEQAIAGADLVILALPYQTSLDVAGSLATALRGCVVVDISNPLNETYTALVTSRDESGAENIREVIGGEAAVVKAFNTTFAGTLAAGSVGGEQIDVFIATDSESGRDRVVELVRTSGMRAIVVGRLRRARELESLGFLGISIQEPLGTGFMSGWKLVMPGEPT